MDDGGFTGFPPAALKFLRALARNNDRDWFAAHRAEYDAHVLAPATAFVIAMGARLARFAPGVNADPRVNRSLFRINRDTRFAKDKRPYKDHVGIWFWEGAGGRMECPGFYFHLTPTTFMVAGGFKDWPEALVVPYRDSVVHDRHGPALTRALAAVTRAGFEVGEATRARVPSGYDREHPRADLLRHDGLVVFREERIGPVVHSPALLDHCTAAYRAMLPLHRWLVALAARAPRPAGARPGRARR
jgi:uncharacterized protein (TIGR02453 family)